MVSHNNFLNIEHKLDKEGFAKVKDLFSTKQKYVIEKEVENIFKKKLLITQIKSGVLDLQKIK